ncbi:hypothetical protein [Limnohabitans sp. Bal53]|uniref:hypothetical protein n=1 Tax=Limnohabitans sp. Bal53 TaxID=1977910 RepID=UPI000D368B9D|nr:hypothetical protein [Limnohabitans sp. Bal53]PUE41681.1 hypothetical protein B9Z50_08380 [Limnohabitans sp. Bal53]
MPDAVNTSVTTYNESKMLLVTGSSGDKLEVNSDAAWTSISLSATDQSALAAAGYQFEAGRSYSVLFDSSLSIGHALIYDSAIALSVVSSNGVDGAFVYY